jgi:glucokinase
MILAGDIGGTKTNLALFDGAGGGLGKLVASGSFRSRNYASLVLILEEFLAGRDEPIERAAFGIAGPIVDDRVETSNLPWVITAEALASVLKVGRVRLVNDLEATALGIETLHDDQIYVLNEGDAELSDEGNRGLIAAGTGLGVGALLQYKNTYLPIASEGGHVDFAPRNELEVGLLGYLEKMFPGHVSYERILSGPGLVNVYSYLRDTGYAEEPEWLKARMAEGHQAAAISGAALARTSPLAEKALDVFVSVYGAMAGNLALMVMATGGLYVGGGIAPKILEKMKDGTFMAAFVEKGRFVPLMRRIPVRIILDDKTALYGAARAAIE